MLDSNGDSWTEEVDCVFCLASVRLPIYRPTVGHCGDNLPESEQGPYLWVTPFYMDEDIAKELFGGALFKLIFSSNPANKKLNAVPFRLNYDSNPYAYGHYPLKPNFGFEPNGVFWICGSCKKTLEGKYDSDFLLSDVVALMIDQKLKTFLSFWDKFRKQRKKITKTA